MCCVPVARRCVRCAARARASRIASQARYGRGAPPGSPYSGVLECPCNSNFGGDPIFYPTARTKLISHAYAALTSGACSTAQRVTSAAACFGAVAAAGVSSSHIANATVSDAAQPNGCS
eukprot:2263598-Prymnesium_polylepis.1